ncbi:MAG: hypothetical protein NUV69_02075 [Candidatus Curtissbacteria bacterium]|nr:hypothetical protein [Candidatus Curtissbacteria bacterium]
MPAKKSHYEQLRKKWLKRHDEARKNLHEKHKEALDYVIDKFPAKDKLASSAVGLLMLSSVVPASTALLPVTDAENTHVVAAQGYNKSKLLGELSLTVPEEMRALTPEEEAKIGEVLSRNFNAKVSADINGLRLNRSYGYIGAEQHLMRYPGDTMATHLTPSEASNHMIYSSGMAPGRGAWGYFAKSKAEMNQTVVERERWYIATQTFLAPNYKGRLSEYRDFFKYRKMLLVNTKTGQTVVCDIGDAGPAEWTGKHLGGSPEVMYHLGYGGGSRKGSVLYFFIDDPEDRIPLGPVEESQKI